MHVAGVRVDQDDHPVRGHFASESLRFLTVEEPCEHNCLADDPLPEFFAWWDIITRSDTDQLEPVLHEVYQLDDERLRRELTARARRHTQERSSLQVVGGQLRQCMTGTGAFHATQ